MIGSNLTELSTSVDALERHGHVSNPLRIDYGLRLHSVSATPYEPNYSTPSWRQNRAFRRVTRRLKDRRVAILKREVLHDLVAGCAFAHPHVALPHCAIEAEFNRAACEEEIAGAIPSQSHGGLNS